MPYKNARPGDFLLPFTVVFSFDVTESNKEILFLGTLKVLGEELSFKLMF
jgi:hypothetical protein